MDGWKGASRRVDNSAGGDRSALRSAAEEVCALYAATVMQQPHSASAK